MGHTGWFAPCLAALAVAGAMACGSNEPSGVTPPTTQPTPRPQGPFPDTDPTWLRQLTSDYPYTHQVGNVRVSSDISPAFSAQHAEHLRLVWRFFDSLYSRNRGDWIAVYYTTDERVFQKALSQCPITIVPGARILTACYLDYPRWFIVPHEIPDLATQQHEIGHDFLYITWPGVREFPWFLEGTAMYFEGGAFDADGTLRVREPHRYCTTQFRRYDLRHDLLPLDALLRLPRSAFLAVPERSYSQSCLLFHCLQDRHASVLPSLIDRINAGAITSNDELVASLLALTARSSEQLGAEYEACARELAR